MGWHEALRLPGFWIEYAKKLLYPILVVGLAFQFFPPARIPVLVALPILMIGTAVLTKRSFQPPEPGREEK